MLPRLFRKMFAPLLVPKSFVDRFLDGLLIRPSQIRAESQDGVTMVPAASAMRHRYRELKLPLIIMAGSEDGVVDAGRHAAQLHQEIPHSILVPNAGHMLHYAVPEEVAEAVNVVAGGCVERRGQVLAFFSRIPRCVSGWKRVRGPITGRASWARLGTRCG
jgi:pimeloyl-ACP methyl ester carboxylesterase